MRLSPYLFMASLVMARCIAPSPDQPDDIPPVITITSPKHGSTVSGIVSIECDAYDNVAIRKTVLIVDGTCEGIEDYTSPYVLPWNTTSFDNNTSHTIVARAYDTSNNYRDYRVILRINNTSLIPQRIRNIATQYTPYELKIMWQSSQEMNFKQYDLYHAYDLSDPRMHLCAKTSRVDTVHTLTVFDLTRTNYFWVKITNDFNFSSTSDPVSVRDPAPMPIIILSAEYSTSEITIAWEKSDENDFKAYQLYTSAQKESDKILLETITDRNHTTAAQSQFDPVSGEWYWIEVVDMYSNTAMSDGWYAVNQPPLPINIYPIPYKEGTFNIQWTRSTETDFASYTLYESAMPDMADEQIIYTASNPDDTGFIVQGVVRNELRYYQLKAKDAWDLTSRGEIRLASSYPRVLYQTMQNSNLDLYSLSIDGKTKVPIASTGSYEFNAQFSPDGTLILFEKHIHSFVSSVCIMEIDGDNLKELFYARSVEANPRFSPVGSIIVCSGRKPNTNLYNSQLILLDPDMTGVTVLETHHGNDLYPQFSPGGTQIVFQSDRLDHWMIYKIRINESRAERLSHRGNIDTKPQFSPDGTKICFVSTRDGDIDVFIMNADGTEQTNLTQSSSSDRNPSFTPDGAQIIFESNRSGDWDIYTMNLDGTGLRNLTNANGDDVNPSFSNDGSALVFQSSRDGNVEIYIMSPDGTNQRNLTNDPAPDSKPIFYHDF